jgi:4'-phosphopantetheinyl transferase EntD
VPGRRNARDPTTCVAEVASRLGEVRLACRRIQLGLPTNIAEEHLIAAWTHQRKAEFRTGRACAREFLASFDADSCATSGAIGFDEGGAPDWPEGFVGSISHKRGFCLVGMARRSALRAVGVDLEREGADAAFARDIATADELDALLRGPPYSPPQAASLMLAAKEAAYKCQYPLTRAILTWRDVVVSFGAGTFKARITGLGGTGEVEGVYALADGWLVTVALLKTLLFSAAYRDHPLISFDNRTLVRKSV